MGKGARYTRINAPIDLIYWQTQVDDKAARKRELKIKKYSHNKKIKLSTVWNEKMNIPDNFMMYEYFVTAPGRVNLLGEHVDYNGGPVLPAAIDRYLIIGANPREDDLVILEAQDLNEKVQFSLAKISEKIDTSGSPFPQWVLYPAGVIATAVNAGLKVKGFEAVYSSNIPIGSGLSSSAAVEVGFAALLREMCAWKLDNTELAKLSQQAENEFVGVNCGIMDQFASANGVAQSAIYLNTNNLKWNPVPLPEDVSIIITDSKKRRSLSTSEYNERRSSCEEALIILKNKLPNIEYLSDVNIEDFENFGHLLSEITYKRAKHVIEECNRVNQALESLQKAEIINFGNLMKSGHQSLRDLYEVSIPELDFLVSTASQIEGCFGSRLTGAGFGGCTVSLVANGKSEFFMKRLKNEYFRVYGINADIYNCQASEGVTVEWRKRKSQT
jgi:galactokinase